MKIKRPITIISAILLGLNCFSQVSFEKGYYIDNLNLKVDCLIKNKDWESNPTSFVYKISDSAEQQTLSINSVKEFGILSKSKYKRYTVKIDRSSNVIGEIDNNVHPVFHEEVLFLKVLVEGEANLYLINDQGLVRYFFNTESSHVEQLVCKSYLSSKNQIVKNNLFRQQLLENLKCQDISFNSIKGIEYKQKDLISLFVKYNESKNSTFVNFEEKQKRDLFNLSLRPGFKYSSLYIENNQIYFNDVNFGGEFGFRCGVEAEFIMPFNNNKWGVFIEPTYQYFTSSVTKVSIVAIGEEITATANYQSIELPIGIRYYLFLSEKSKLYLNASFNFDFNFDSYIEIVREDGLQLKYMDILTQPNFAIGFGYKYNDRYNLELKYHSSDVLGTYGAWDSSYKTVSVIFGYSFL